MRMRRLPVEGIEAGPKPPDRAIPQERQLGTAFAPKGQCDWCDARRSWLDARRKLERAVRKRGGKDGAKDG